MKPSLILEELDIFDGIHYEESCEVYTHVVPNWVTDNDSGSNNWDNIISKADNACY